MVFNTVALERLAKAVEGSEIGPESFEWPPDNGQGSLCRTAAGSRSRTSTPVGRDFAIFHALDQLRAMRFPLLAKFSGLKSLFVVLGPSGSGKSSFLRAGLMPRLQRDDRRFLVLGTVRPDRNPLTGDQGLAAVIYNCRQRLGLFEPPLGEIKKAVSQKPARVYDLLIELRRTAAEIDSLAQVASSHQDANGNKPAEASAPTLVLALDQAEGLLLRRGWRES